MMWLDDYALLSGQCEVSLSICLQDKRHMQGWRVFAQQLLPLLPAPLVKSWWYKASSIVMTMTLKPLHENYVAMESSYGHGHMIRLISECYRQSMYLLLLGRPCCVSVHSDALISSAYLSAWLTLCGIEAVMLMHCALLPISSLECSHTKLYKNKKQVVHAV